MSATPDPSAAAQSGEPCLHVPGIGEPACSCTHCRSYGGHPCPHCRQPKPPAPEGGDDDSICARCGHAGLYHMTGDDGCVIADCTCAPFLKGTTNAR